MVDVGAQMPHRCIEQLELMLQAGLLERRVCRGVQLGSRSSVTEVDLVHVLHEAGGLLLANVLVKVAAKVVGDVVLSVREGPRTAKAAHDGAALAVDAGLYAPSVYGAPTPVERVARLEHAHTKIGAQLAQLVGRIDASRARANNYYIIIHSQTSPVSVRHLPDGWHGENGMGSHRPITNPT